MSGCSFQAALRAVAVAPVIVTVGGAFAAMVAAACAAPGPVPPSSSAPGFVAIAIADSGASPSLVTAVDAAAADAEPAKDGGAVSLRDARVFLVVRANALTLPGGTVVDSACVDPGFDAAVAMALPNAPLESDPIERVDVDPVAGFDVDGDGAPDTYTFIGGGVQDQGTVRIYVMRDKCGYAVGSVDQRNGITVLRPKSHGLHDLRTIHFTADFARSVEATYRFDGHTYKEIAHRPAPAFPSRATF